MLKVQHAGKKTHLPPEVIASLKARKEKEKAERKSHRKGHRRTSSEAPPRTEEGLLRSTSSTNLMMSERTPRSQLEAPPRPGRKRSVSLQDISAAAAAAALFGAGDDDDDGESTDAGERNKPLRIPVADAEPAPEGVAPSPVTVDSQKHSKPKEDVGETRTPARAAGPAPPTGEPAAPAAAAASSSPAGEAPLRPARSHAPAGGQAASDPVTPAADKGTHAHRSNKPQQDDGRLAKAVEEAGQWRQRAEAAENEAAELKAKLAASLAANSTSRPPDLAEGGGNDAAERAAQMQELKAQLANTVASLEQWKTTTEQEQASMRDALEKAQTEHARELESLRTDLIQAREEGAAARRRAQQVATQAEQDLAAQEQRLRAEHGAQLAAALAERDGQLEEAKRSGDELRGQLASSRLETDQCRTQVRELEKKCADVESALAGERSAHEAEREAHRATGLDRDRLAGQLSSSEADLGAERDARRADAESHERALKEAREHEASSLAAAEDRRAAEEAAHSGEAEKLRAELARVSGELSAERNRAAELERETAELHRRASAAEQDAQRARRLADFAMGDPRGGGATGREGPRSPAPLRVASPGAGSERRSPRAGAALRPPSGSGARSPRSPSPSSPRPMVAWESEPVGAADAPGLAAGAPPGNSKPTAESDPNSGPPHHWAERGFPMSPRVARLLQPYGGCAAAPDSAGQLAGADSPGASSSSSPSVASPDSAAGPSSATSSPGVNGPRKPRVCSAGSERQHPRRVHLGGSTSPPERPEWYSSTGRHGNRPSDLSLPSLLARAKSSSRPSSLSSSPYLQKLVPPAPAAASPNSRQAQLQRTAAGPGPSVTSPKASPPTPSSPTTARNGQAHGRRPPPSPSSS